MSRIACDIWMVFKEVLQRLAVQHKVWTLMTEGLYPKEAEAAIQSALASANNSRQAMILDIGSGSGSWWVIAFVIIYSNC